ncbi:MAG: hypothetical protein V1704_03200 [Candidatus Vogelbacteria bacterium]
MTDNMTIQPESSDFYRPTTRAKRGGMPAFIIKLSGGKMSEQGANAVLLGFAIVVFIISIIILVKTF